MKLAFFQHHLAPLVSRPYATSPRGFEAPNHVHTLPSAHKRDDAIENATQQHALPLKPQAQKIPFVVVKPQVSYIYRRLLRCVRENVSKLLEHVTQSVINAR